MKRYLPFIIVAAVLVITLVAGTLFLRQKRREQLDRRAQAEQARAANADSLAGAVPARTRGPESAPVTLEEFGDFECPPCGMLSPVLDKIEQDFKGRLRFVFREFPMAAHAHGFQAASAAEAAGLQGKFWEMHDRLFQERFVWPKSPDVEKQFTDYAADLNLDVERFRKDMSGEEVKKRIASDQKRGRALGVDRTPTLFINDQLVPVTSFGPDSLRKLVEEAEQKPR